MGTMEQRGFGALEEWVTEHNLLCDNIPLAAILAQAQGLFIW